MSNILWRKANTGVTYNYNTAYSPDLNLYVNIADKRILSEYEYYICTSTDSYNWTKTKLTGVTNGRYAEIIYSNRHKLFISLSYLGPLIIYSSDGINWKEANVPSTYGSGIGLVYSEEKDLFVSTGSILDGSNINNIAQIITSKDGINWSEPIQIPEFENLGYLIYSSEKGIFMTCASPGNSINTQKNGILVSQDGYNWTITYTNTDIDIFSVVYGNGKFIAFGNTNFNLDEPYTPKKQSQLLYATSTDGYNWSSFQSLMGLENYVITFPIYSQDYNMFVISTLDVSNGIYIQNENQPGIVYTSEDGINWKKSLEMPINQKSEVVNFLNGKFFVSGRNLDNEEGGYIYTGDYISDICLLGDTPINTDQGIVAIDKIVPGKHTINNTDIVKITNTISSERSFVCFEKHSLGINCPTQRTIMTPGHKVLYKGKLVEAKHFIGRLEGVRCVPNNGENVYNVLHHTHGTMRANGMVLETLHPENRIAKNIYNSL